MKHKFYKCGKNCDDPYCNYCYGGLGYCVVCDCAECELTTDCYGDELNEVQKDYICQKKIDYIGGEWVSKE